MSRLIRLLSLASLVALAGAVGAAPSASGGPLNGFSLGGGGDAASPRQATTQSLDGIAAVVNDDVILKSQLARATARARARTNTNVPRDKLRSRVLDRLIMRKLQLQEARRRGVTISDQALARGMRRLARRNNMSPTQLKRAARQRGISGQSLEQRIRERMLISKVQRRSLKSKISISQNDVDQYLRTRNLQAGGQTAYRFRRIAAAAGSDAARAALQKLVRRARAGESFANLAGEFADNKAARSATVVDWTPSAKLPASIGATLNGLETGRISDVIRSGDRLMVVKLLDRRPTAMNGRNASVTEIKVRHILLEPSVIRSRTQTRALAERLRRQIKTGASFSALAKQYSDDDATAADGGALGWIKIGTVSPKTRRALTELAPGEVSPVLSTASGLEIVKLENRRTRNAAEQRRRDKARRILTRNRARERSSSWQQQLRGRAFVDIRIDDYRPSAGT